MESRAGSIEQDVERNAFIRTRWRSRPAFAIYYRRSATVFGGALISGERGGGRWVERPFTPARGEAERDDQRPD
jgi:hypothetical protein